MPCSAVFSKNNHSTCHPTFHYLVIAFIGNRPALQIGPYQVLDYDISWLDDALQRAAKAAEQDEFPLLEEIRDGVELYLENKCPLRLLNLEDLFARMRRMLVQIGCERIAEKLKPLAPPLTVSLPKVAILAGNGFELAFFEAVRSELAQLEEVGAEKVHFTGLKESALILGGCRKWNKQCDFLLAEIRQFLETCSRDFRVSSSSLKLSLDA